MKPDWKNAPIWANYLALDGRCAEYYWYENYPVRDSIVDVYYPNFGRMKFAGDEKNHFICSFVEKRP